MVPFGSSRKKLLKSYNNDDMQKSVELMTAHTNSKLITVTDKCEHVLVSNEYICCNKFSIFDIYLF